MTSFVAEFDKHKRIEYLSIDHLFWNTFPYKVIVREEIERPDGRSFTRVTPSGGLNAEFLRAIDKKWMNFRRERNDFYFDRKKHCPADKALWRSSDNGQATHTFSFFFKDAESALHFIQKNKKHITTVYRPENEAQIAALSEDRKRVLRKTLYQDRYRYCVEFKDVFTSDAEKELDEAVLALFNNKKNARRYQYEYTKRRRLYLKHELDILHVKLALHDKIRVQTEAYLKDEI